jgi:signal transduction histidine kinase
MVVEPPTPRRRRHRGVRARTTLAAVAVVGIVLVIASAALVIALRRATTNSVRTTAELRADDIATALRSGESPTLTGIDDELVVQVVGPDGRLVASSPNVVADEAVVDLASGDSARATVDVRDDEIERETYLFVARATQTPDGEGVVLVGRTLEQVAQSTSAMMRFLALGLPVVLVVVGVTTWFVVGRALAPVERIRAEVSEISAHELHRRVPEPEADDEIGRLAHTMNEMLDRLERSKQQQQRFVSDASHELRSPVTTIRHLAEVAVAHPEGTGTEQLGADVLAEDLRLERLVDDLLWMARADEHTLSARRGPVDLDELVLDEARRVRETTNLRVEVSDVSPGQVHGDASQLRRLLRNLVDNAGRHAATSVALSVAETGGDVVLRVDDDGPGVPIADRVRVFDRFVRLDAARDREQGGTGLGLSIAAQVVAAHGGAVTIGEAPLGGARVEVRLPRHA